ncbi:MAG TPA: alanine dehydrogenase [Acidimicrobiales bacterium]|nr:alanine dehydrogenase [Acidimicrobiales bacterium]
MRVGVVREIKIDELRVAITPAGARELVGEGHEVIVESGAGVGAGYADDAYGRAGARVVPSAHEVWGAAELVVKVKEPQPSEIPMVRAGQVVFGYLHLAADPALARSLAATGATCVAYESVRDGRHLPLLIPMSEVAGRIAGLACAYHLGRVSGGRGVLMGGIAGVAPAEVVVIGAGTAGTNAAAQAVGLGASVKLLDRDLLALRTAEERFDGRVSCLYSTTSVLEELVAGADALIGSVLVPGARAPHLVSRAMVASMPTGSVLVDISIDQGGCIETSRPTTHSHPTYVEEGVIHYCVTNMPSLYPVTSTSSLTNATLPFVHAIADQGIGPACATDPRLAAGVNLVAGTATLPVVAEQTGIEYVALATYFPEVAAAAH